jgi:hypothetical protein
LFNLAAVQFGRGIKTDTMKEPGARRKVRLGAVCETQVQYFSQETPAFSWYLYRFPISFRFPYLEREFGSDFQDAQIAYELGRSIAGMRADDFLNCARYGAKRATGDRDGTVELVAIGNVGVPALHAAALEPALFRSVKSRQMIVSWAKIVHNRMNNPVLMGSIIHGVLPNPRQETHDRAICERHGQALPRRQITRNLKRNLNLLR